MAAFDFTQGSLPEGATFARAVGPWSRVVVTTSQVDDGSNSPDGQAVYESRAILVTSTAPDQPRFDYDPKTLASRGILIERASTNLLIASENITASGSWAQSSVTTAADVAASPAGNPSADKIRATATSGVHQTSAGGAGANWSVETGKKYVKSWYAKAAEYRFWRLNAPAGGFANGAQVVFDVTNKVVYASGDAVGVIEDAPNGYVRVIATFTATSTGSFGTGAHAINSPDQATSSFTGDGSAGIIVWGAQAELGPATSYIPTNSAQATRPAETLTLDWTTKGLNDGDVVALRYTFDDNSFQDVQTTISAAGNVVPLSLNRSRIKTVATPQTGATSTTGNAAGSTTVSGDGRAKVTSFGTAAGTTVASGGGGSRVIASGTGAGLSAASGAGAMIVTASGTAAGTSTVTAVGAARALSAGTAQGSGAAVGQGSSQALVTGRGTASGAGTANGDGRSIARGDGATSGAAAAVGAGTALITTAGIAVGLSTGSGAGLAAACAQGQATGSTTVQANSPNRPSFFPPEERAATLVDVGLRVITFSDRSSRQTSFADQADRTTTIN